jgi:UDP:flavonoid glycosyltransferase YjiC (YdhE family)
LRAADVLVANATTTGVLGALSAGVPSLLIPLGGEQPDVAAVCEQAGVARKLRNEEATPPRLLEELSVLLTEPRYQECAAQYQAAFAKIDGCARAADLLEILGTTRCEVSRQEVEGLCSA